MKKWYRGGKWLMLPGLLLSHCGYAQFILGAQVRIRPELRNGQGAPQTQGAPPAFFTSQRTRLMAGFSAYRIKLGLTVQDVRVWGQDVSTINRTTTPDNNGIMLHEAWAEIMLTDTVIKSRSLSIKAGRQELVYDDSRLLGNLDWLQQGRRHDAAVIRYESSSWTMHAGFAFNQNKEKASGTEYNPVPPGNYAANTNGGMAYKSLEYLYVSRMFKTGHLSFLFLSDQFPKYHIDSVEHTAVKVWESATYGRFTTGLFYTGRSDRLSYTATAYFQGGTNGNGQTVSASLWSGVLQYAVSKVFSAGAGADYITPDFDPLYGTPHKFCGTMDYFYAASPFGNKGLQDYYIRSRLNAGTRCIIAADVHGFYSTAALNGKKRYFGTETDITASYTLTDIIGLEAGYSHFWSTVALAQVKNVVNAASNSNWAYVMINIHPQWKIK
ncbi:MAG TPA: alginate export family protein [Chitinophaga sp.]|uniref:alginate export family protein n=1 Tax=Chitinophaga sp. TaxID=1869181 RepID=UPI002C50E605|nr:alginate export family protein [Chitinophaga sp.]HVI47456.1 alginate export family protein [Chitinophaga sp.]